MSETRQQVAIRVRPLIKREIRDCLPIQWETTGNQIDRIDHSQSYVFDKVIGPKGSNYDVYSAMVKDLVYSAIKGINGTVFAYGQTASGKTYTMLGSSEEPGVINHAIEDLFRLVKEATDRSFLISMIYKEIYNEDVSDLIGHTSGLRIRESEDGVVYAEGCEQMLVECPDDILKLLAHGDKYRRVGATNMNEKSSRSHAIATLMIESKLEDDGNDGAVLVSQLNFVDLAGSEKAAQTGAVGQRLKEGGHINTSLLALSNCINKLAEKGSHIPYRDSKLTRLLKNSIGGNSMTSIVANVTPASLEETISTLRFASRAKKVSTKPIVNEVVDERTLTKRLQKRVNELELQLARKADLDQEAKHALIKELLKPTEAEEEFAAAKQRRMTWCGPKMGGPLLDLRSSETGKCELIEVGGAGSSAFRRPSFPGKISQRRKRHLGTAIGTSSSAIAEEVFLDASKLPDLSLEDSTGSANQSTTCRLSAAGLEVSSARLHQSPIEKDSLHAAVAELKEQVKLLEEERKTLTEEAQTTAIGHAELRLENEMARSALQAAEKKAESAEEKAASALENIEAKLGEMEELRREVARRSNYDQVLAELDALRKKEKQNEDITEQQVVGMAEKLMEAETKVQRLTEELKEMREKRQVDCARCDKLDGTQAVNVTTASGQPTGQTSSMSQTEQEHLKEQLIKARKVIELRDIRITGLERGYDQLFQQHEDLLKFYHNEREIYATRTPGQIVEKRLTLQLIELKDRHNKDMAQVQVSASKLAEENFLLKKRLGENVALPTRVFALSPLQEHSSPLSDVSLNGEAMPSITTTPESSPMLPPPKLNLDQSCSKPTSVDVGINTDIDIKWFDLDDTILGVKRTGTAISADETLPPFFPTPAKRLVCEVSENVAEFKAGLQTAYNMIADLNDRHNQDEQLIEEKERQLSELIIVLSEQKEIMDQLQQAGSLPAKEQGGATEHVESENELDLSITKKSMSEEVESLQRVNSSTSEQLQLAEQQVHKLRCEHQSEMEQLRCTFEEQMQSMTSKYQVELGLLRNRLSEVDNENSFKEQTQEVLGGSFVDSCGVGGDDMNALREQHAQQIEEMNAAHEHQVKLLVETHEQQLETVRSQAVDHMQQELSNLREEVRGKHSELENLMAETSAENNELIARCQAAEQRDEELKAQMCELEEVKVKYQELEKLMAETSTDRRDFATKCQAAEERVEELKSQVCELEEEAKHHELEKLRTETTTENGEFATKCQAAEQRVEELDKQVCELEEVKVKYRELQKLLTETSKDNNDFATKCQAAEERVEELKSQVCELEEVKVKYQELQKLMTETSTDRRDFATKCQAAEERVEELKSQVCELEEVKVKYQELEKLMVETSTDNRDFATKCQAAEERVEELKRQVCELEEKVKHHELEKLMTETTTENGEFATKCQAAEERVEELEKQVCELKEVKVKYQELQKLMTETSTDRRDFATKCQAAEERVEELKSQVCELEEVKVKYQELEKLMVETSTDNRDFATKCQAAEERVEELKRQVCELEEKVKHHELEKLMTETTTENGEFATKCQAAEERVEELEKQVCELEEVKVKYQELQKLLTETSKDNNDFATKCQAAEERVEDLKSQVCELEEVKVKYRELEKLMTETSTDRRDFATKCQAAEERVEELKSQVCELKEKAKHHELEKLRTETTTENGEFATKCQAAEQRVEELEKQVCELKEKLSAQERCEDERQQAEGSSRPSTYHRRQIDKLKRDNRILESSIANMQKLLDNPELRVKKAQDQQERCRLESERYHDELVQIDWKIQKFGEKYFGYGHWDIDGLCDKVSPHLPQSLKEAAQKSMDDNKPTMMIGDCEFPSPVKVEDKGELCEHLRRRQHFKIVELESSKVGLSYEVTKWKREIKELNKVHEMLNHEKQKHDQMKQNYESLKDLLDRTEQELVLAREKCSASDKLPPHAASDKLPPHAASDKLPPHAASDKLPPHAASDKLPPHAASYKLPPHVASHKLPPHSASSTTSSSYKLSGFDFHVQMTIKGLEMEKYSLSRKYQQLEKTLDKLRYKYVVLKEKYEKVTGSKSITSHENSASAPLVPSEMANSATVKEVQASPSLNLNTNLGLDEPDNCETQ